jgi:beta-lactamase regulating signal transducer with metallopeptidase domain
MAEVSSRQRNSRLLISDEITFPAVIGRFSPAVVLPRWLIQSQDIKKLRPVLAHEAAHLASKDARGRWIAAAFQVVFYYQPLFWWLRRHLQLCQEYLADAQAAEHAKSAIDYADQLVALLKTAQFRGTAIAIQIQCEANSNMDGKLETIDKT